MCHQWPKKALFSKPALDSRHIAYVKLLQSFFFLNQIYDKHCKVCLNENILSWVWLFLRMNRWFKIMKNFVMKKLSYALSTQPLSFIKLQLFSSISFFPVRNVQLSFEIKNYDKKIISVRKSVSIYFNGFSHDGNIFNYFLQHSKSFFFSKNSLNFSLSIKS